MTSNDYNDYNDFNDFHFQTPQRPSSPPPNSSTPQDRLIDWRYTYVTLHEGGWGLSGDAVCGRVGVVD